MDLDEAADELYAISPDDFMARRTALAKQAKEAGEKLLAKQITALRKPTRSAWLVNLVARAEPERLAELVELGDALQQAQQAMDGDAMRRLSRDRRTMIDTLARRAGELGRDEGHPPADGAVQEVSQTLQAALGDPAIAEVVQAGRLHQALSYGGFGPDDLASALAASMPTAKKKAPAKATPAAPEDDEADADEDDEDDAEARAAAEQARAEADAAQAAAEEAETAADEATTRADELADQVEDLRRQLRDTEAAEREARDAARAARKHYTELRRAAAAAEQAAKRAEEGLSP
jgi:hypothetical protein